eukprot:TRINITY_DN11738_c0_g1_i1.p1 TRINITY_DN11738_c0_g1~~TRINITY_DN11738_c0_g1_i1.p1  ORF type:complete len:429 (+),score=49.85 TRINITY_DN11738_c0_g1_i1:72-1358(+)
MDLLSLEELTKLEYLDSLLQILPDTSNQSERIEKWLNWCEAQNKNLKTISRPVPSGILSTESHLLDVKVFGRGPDDKIYQNNPLIRQRVARGNAVLKIIDSEGNVHYRPLVFALKKFSGERSVDEDIVEEATEADLYFLQPLSRTKEIVATVKANGEAAHLSIHHFGEDGFVFCIGSKNVHLLAKCPEDIDKYEETRYNVAKVVARAVFSTLSKLDPQTQQVMYSISHHCQLTWTFEILNPNTQHVVNLSDLKDPLLNFISWTVPDFEGKSSSLCALRPDKAFDIVKTHFKMKTVGFTLVESKESRSEYVKRDYGYEGEVFYLLDVSDNVFGLIKTKTIWYIMLRAIREKVKHNYRFSEYAQRMKKRINEIQKWLNLSEASTQSWLSLALDFGNWIDSGSFKKDLSTEFPIAWKAFLLDTNSTDRINP